MGDEQAETRMKRLRMRSMRRGMKEMDLILARFSETGLAELPPTMLDDYESLLSENDQQLYSWGKPTRGTTNGAPGNRR
jgi:antitoxin CptB